MGMTAKQEQNYHFFTSKLHDFISDETLKNKFLVINDEKVKGIYDTFDRAIEFATATFPENDFIIQQAIDENEKINFIYCAR